LRVRSSAAPRPVAVTQLFGLLVIFMIALALYSLRIWFTLPPL
jgi:hypothetical protein